MFEEKKLPEPNLLVICLNEGITALEGFMFLRKIKGAFHDIFFVAASV